MNNEPDVVVICPRVCRSPRTEHCIGTAVNGRARCWHCGKFMPMDEAIEVPAYLLDDEPIEDAEG